MASRWGGVGGSGELGNDHHDLRVRHGGGNGIYNPSRLLSISHKVDEKTRRKHSPPKETLHELGRLKGREVTGLLKQKTSPGT